MREPLLWFVVIGALLFAADAYRKPDPIVVNDAVKDQIAGLWETQMGRAPDEKDLVPLVERWVRDEMFYREAIRLGLEKEDVIVRRRLVQKLEFLAQDVSDEAVSEKDIETFYEENLAAYRRPTRYSFSQIFFDNEAKANAIFQQLNSGADWLTLGDATLLPRTIMSKDREQITSALGASFTNELDQLLEGQWVGPLPSAFGFHLVRLDVLKQAEVPPLAEVKQKVLDDLLYKRRERSLKNYQQELKARYQVVYE